MRGSSGLGESGIGEEELVLAWVTGRIKGTKRAKMEPQVDCRKLSKILNISPTVINEFYCPDNPFNVGIRLEVRQPILRR